LIQIPASVEVIDEEAFAGCQMLQEVRVARNSKMRRIGRDAFSKCRYLYAVDVPSRTNIRGDFIVMAKVRDEAGHKRKRVRFRPRHGPERYDWPGELRA
jgi:hypothetical protein